MQIEAKEQQDNAEYITITNKAYRQEKLSLFQDFNHYLYNEVRPKELIFPF
jgi:hypothetical protein